MSMILDAIKRSNEAPEGGGAVTCLDTEHYMAPAEPMWKRAGRKLIMLSALGLMGVALILVTSSNDSGSDASQIENDVSTEQIVHVENGGSVTASSDRVVPDGSSQTPRTSATPAVASSPRDRSTKGAGGAIRDRRPIVIPNETQPTKGSGPNTEALSSLYAAMNKEAEAALERPTASEAETEVFLDVRDEAAEVLEAPVGSEEGTTVDFAEILAQARKELGVQPLVKSGEPLLETLSQQTKDQIPSLIYSEHKYSASGRSEVVLNGQSLTRQQRVGPFTVVEILPDSVILRWREIQFRVRARNSWINL